jgi:hypothetical protein
MFKQLQSFAVSFCTVSVIHADWYASETATYSRCNCRSPIGMTRAYVRNNVSASDERCRCVKSMRALGCTATMNGIHDVSSRRYCPCSPDINRCKKPYSDLGVLNRQNHGVVHGTKRRQYLIVIIIESQLPCSRFRAVEMLLDLPLFIWAPRSS